MPIRGCKDIYYRCIYKAGSLKHSFSRLLNASSVGFFRNSVCDGGNVSCFLIRTS